MIAIIKYYITSIGMVNVAFEEVTNPRKKGKMLSKCEAKERIRELGLVKAHSDENGTIWDTPDKALLAKLRRMEGEIKEI